MTIFSSFIGQTIKNKSNEHQQDSCSNRKKHGASICTSIKSISAQTVKTPILARACAVTFYGASICLNRAFFGASMCMHRLIYKYIWVLLNTPIYLYIFQTACAHKIHQTKFLSSCFQEVAC